MSTDFISKCYIWAFVKFENDSEIRFFFFCCKKLSPKSKSQNIFFSFIFGEELSWYLYWRHFLMVFVSFLGKKNIMNAFTIYYFLHTRKVLVLNFIEDEMKNILDDGQKMASFSKQKLFHLIFQKTMQRHLSKVFKG